MSLDLYIKKKTPIIKSGTGVYARENGRMFELKTVNEVMSRFPNTDPSSIKVEEYETDEYFHTNLTHNLCEMADHIPVGGNFTAYHLLWHPEKIYGDPDVKKRNEEWDYTEEGWHLREDYVSRVEDAMKYAMKHEKTLSKYNPDNGWGSYEQLRDALCELFQELYPIEDMDEYYIVASV